VTSPITTCRTSTSAALLACSSRCPIRATPRLRPVCSSGRSPRCKNRCASLVFGWQAIKVFKRKSPRAAKLAMQDEASAAVPLSGTRTSSGSCRLEHLSDRGAGPRASSRWSNDSPSVSCRGCPSRTASGLPVDIAVEAVEQCGHGPAPVRAREDPPIIPPGPGPPGQHVLVGYASECGSVSSDSGWPNEPTRQPAGRRGSVAAFHVRVPSRRKSGAVRDIPVPATFGLSASIRLTAADQPPAVRPPPT